jgi:hypothetical protein
MVEAQLAPGASVAGTVRDAAGKVIAGAWVAWSDPLNDFAALRVQANEEGHFHLEDVGLGSVLLRAGKGELHTQEIVQTAWGRTSVWDPVLRDGPRIIGKVLGPGNEPVAQTRVGWMRRGDSEPSRWVETGPDGAFVLDNVGDQQVELQVQHHGAVVSQLLGVAAGTDDVLIRLLDHDLATARVHGRVVDEMGVPLTASVWLRAGLVRQSISANTDGITGAFAFGPLPATTFDVQVAVRGRGTLCRRTLLEPGTDQDLGDLVMPRPGRVDLTLRDESGNAIDSFGGICTAAGLGAAVARFERGKAEVEALPPGRYLVSVPCDRNRLASAEFTVCTDQVTQVALVARTGVCLDVSVRDTAPCQVIWVRVMNGGQLAAVWSMYAVNGVFGTIRPCLLPGSYELDCCTSDGRTTKRRVEVHAADDVGAVTIELPGR